MVVRHERGAATGSPLLCARHLECPCLRFPPMDDIEAGGAAHPKRHPDERRWCATAFYAGHLRRFEPRPAVEARGTSEAEALRELAAALWMC